LAQQSAAERCREAGSDAAPIACLEAALAGDDDAATPSPEDTPRRATATPPENADSGPPDRASGIGAEQVRARNRASDKRLARKKLLNSTN
jgi:hypothetical protein